MLYSAAAATAAVTPRPSREDLARRRDAFYRNCLAAAEETVFFAKEFPCTEVQALLKDQLIVDYLISRQLEMALGLEQPRLLPPAATSVVAAAPTGMVPGLSDGLYTGIDRRVNITDLWMGQPGDLAPGDIRMNTLTRAVSGAIAASVTDIVEALDFKSGAMEDRVGYVITLPTTSDLLRMRDAFAGTKFQDLFQKEWDKFADAVGSVTRALNEKLADAFTRWPKLQLESDSCPQGEGIVTASSNALGGAFQKFFGLSNAEETAEVPFASIVSGWRRPVSDMDAINNACKEISAQFSKLPTDKRFRSITGIVLNNEYLTLAEQWGSGEDIHKRGARDAVKRDLTEGDYDTGMEMMKQLGNNEKALSSGSGPVLPLRWPLSFKASSGTIPFIRKVFSVLKDQARRYEAKLIENVEKRATDAAASLGAIRHGLVKIVVTIGSGFPSRTAVNAIKASAVQLQLQAAQLASSMRESTLLRLRRNDTSRVIAESEFISNALVPITRLADDAMEYITAAQNGGSFDMKSAEAWEQDQSSNVVSNGEFSLSTNTANTIMNGLRIQTVAAIRSIRVMSAPDTFAMIFEQAAAEMPGQFPNRGTALSYLKWAFGATAIGALAGAASSALDIDSKRSVDTIKNPVPLYNQKEVQRKLAAYEAIASAVVKRQDVALRATTMDNIIGGSREFARGVIRAIGASSPLMLVGWAAGMADPLALMFKEVASVMYASVAATTNPFSVTCLIMVRMGFAGIIEYFLRYARFREWRTEQIMSVLFQTCFYVYAIENADILPNTSELFDIILFQNVMRKLAGAPMAFVSFEVITQILNLCWRAVLSTVYAVTSGDTPLLLSPDGVFAEYIRRRNPGLIQVVDRFTSKWPEFDTAMFFRCCSHTARVKVNSMVTEFKNPYRRLRTAGGYGEEAREEIPGQDNK